MDDGTPVSAGRRLAFAVLVAAATKPAIAERVYRVGVLGVEGFDASGSAITDELARRGYVAGRNLQFVVKNAESNAGLLDVMAAELVADRVDVIVSVSSNASAWAAKRATATIPIVMLSSRDPVEDGLVKSLARPGGNVTGSTTEGLELPTKRLQLLMEALQPRAPVGVLIYEPFMTRPSVRKTVEALEAIAKTDKRPFAVAAVRKVERGDDLERSLEFLRARGVTGVLINSWSTIGASIERVVSLFLRNGMASIMEWGGFAEAGILMTYAEATGEPERRVAAFVDRILKGARPADLPIERGTRFELAINLKTAAALHIEIPKKLLLRADTLIR